MDIFIEVFQQNFSGILQLGLDGFFQFFLKGCKGTLYFILGSTFLIDIQYASFKINTGFNGAKNIIRGTKNATEKIEFMLQEFMYPSVGLILFIEKVSSPVTSFSTCKKSGKYEWKSFCFAPTYTSISANPRFGS